MSRCGRCTRLMRDRGALKTCCECRPGFVVRVRRKRHEHEKRARLNLTGLLHYKVAEKLCVQAAQKEWERVAQAATKAGKVAMIGPVGAYRRDALTIAFEKKYGISVEYQADSGAGILPRLSAERKADRYLWDVVITGTTTTLENLI